MPDLTSLAGRAALVTGASRGIGYGVAAALLARGASVTITGRRAPQALVDAADLVTEMEMVKHPFRSGVKAQKGIEF